MYEYYVDTLESYIITEPAQEGFGLDLLKFVGKGIGKVAKALGIFIGINVALVGTVLLSTSANAAIHKKRYNNPTPEEKLSRDNFNKIWLPEIDAFRKLVLKDIDEADKKFDIKKFISTRQSINKGDDGVYINGIPSRHTYDYSICWLNWEACQYPDADGDDEGNPELVKEFSEKISKLKPYFDKWKKEAKKFEPYFKLELNVEDPDEDYYFCNFFLSLNCKHVDKLGILKPGLPEFIK